MRAMGKEFIGMAVRFLWDTNPFIFQLVNKKHLGSGRRAKSEAKSCCAEIKMKFAVRNLETQVEMWFISYFLHIPSTTCPSGLPADSLASGSPALCPRLGRGSCTIKSQHPLLGLSQHSPYL